MSESTEPAPAPSQESMTPAIDVTQLTQAIRVILKDADLEQLSRRMIRKQLETQFRADLSSYKDVINSTILETIEEQQAEEEEEPEPSEEGEDDDDDEQVEQRVRRKKSMPVKKKTKKETPKKKRKRKTEDEDGKKNAVGGFNAKLCLSPELARVVGADRMARPQVVKALWAYIREHNLQDPNNKKSIILDDTLRAVFQRESFTMFSMNKFVKRHVRKPDDLPPGGWSQIPRDGVSSDEDTEVKPKKKVVKRKKKTTSTEEGDNDSKTKTHAFNVELSLSPELASLVGTDLMARPQIVKALWAYIHEHELQDPQDKRTILLDDRMQRVFQRDSFTMFSMNKFIKRHARKLADLPPGGWADIPRDGLSSDEDEAKTKKKPRKGK
uniref:DM2 domain-containing protein n=1 Tax=Hyaloperonospora arabidopsidis (strain Emoy2) TaxID=559515 RepID=M4C0A8_HYAAE